MICPQGWAPDNFHVYVDNCAAHVATRNTIHFFQVLLALIATLRLTRCLKIYYSKKLRKRLLPRILLFGIFGQLFSAVTGILVLVYQEGTAASLLTTMWTTALHFLGTIVLWVLLLIPFKGLVSQNTINISVKWLRFCAYIFAPLCFVSFSWHILGDRWKDDFRYRNIIVGSYNVLLACILLILILIQMFCIKKVNDGFEFQRTSKGPKKVKAEMFEFRNRINIIFKCILCILVILFITVSKMSVSILMHNDNSMGWVIFPLELGSTSIAAIVVSRLVKLEKKPETQASKLPSRSKSNVSQHNAIEP